jgi:hypothetical protein
MTYKELDDNHIWTIEKAKELLPAIHVKLSSGKIVPASVSGRQLPFAQVHCLQGSWELSWKTYVHILNTSEVMNE